MKRTKPSPTPCTYQSPGTPPTPRQTQFRCKDLSTITKKARSIILIPRSFPTSTTSITWTPLNLNKSELYLPLTFPTGQTFRWKQTGPLQYTGTVGSHLISLKQLENNDVGFFCHSTEDENAAKEDLFDFLNMGISLNELWKGFKASDERFGQLAGYLEGARVLRQDPLECLIQFICSSNNNISRITKMVDYISKMGKFLGSVEGFDFFEFPTLDRLVSVSEAELREAGFGYRSKYIVRTVAYLHSKPCGGIQWLTSLRKLDLQGAIENLSSLSGVGPKVAACIALFSLDQHHAIPVDTHVWQIATKYLIPELAGSRLTPKVCHRVSEAFVSKYGTYAGWAQTLLFIAELPAQKAILPSSFWE